MKQFVYMLLTICLLWGCEKDPEPPKIDPPTCGVSAIVTNSASIDVTIKSAESISEVGVVYSPDFSFNSTQTRAVFTKKLENPIVKLSMTGLTPNTRYFYKAYVADKSGNKVFGKVDSFASESLKLSLSESMIPADDLEGTYTFNVSSNTGWTISCDQDWCKVSPVSGSKDATISFDLSQNITNKERIAIITVRAGSLSEKITVAQKGVLGYLSVPSDNLSVGPEEKTYDLVVTSNLDWTISSSQSWCALSQTAGSKDGTLQFMLSENTGEQSRDAILTVKADTLTRKITINQQSQSAYLSVSSNYFSVGPESESYNFTISSNKTWSVSSSQSWCTVSTKSGSNNQTLSFTLSSNTTGTERKAFITVTAGKNTQQITVIQQGESLSLSVSTNSFSVNAGSGRYEFSITSNAEWTISSSQSWCTASQTSGSNSRIVSFNVLQNPSLLGRTAIITVTSGALSQEITVSQSGEASSLTVSSSSFIVTSISKSYDFTITSNSAWTVTTDQSWCTVSQVSGSNIKSVSFSVSQNTSLQERTAIITVTSGAISKEITVKQSGETPSLSVSSSSFTVTSVNKSYDFTITSNSAWTVTTDQSWCTVSQASGSNSMTMSFTVSQNSSTQERTAIIKVTAGSESKEIIVKQSGEVSVINIPDANFKAYLVANFDKNGDGEISIEEAKDVTSIWCGGQNISSLQGIEYFPALWKLSCHGNQLKSLDLSKNLGLRSLVCSSNSLTALDLSKNIRLLEMWCDSNQLTSLDLTNNTEIEFLSCSFNKFTSLDFTNNVNLTFVTCINNQISSLNVTNNLGLETLQCDYNKLASLDISKNNLLNVLSCGSNQLTSLDISKNTILTSLQCNLNQLTTLDVGNHTKLTYLQCGSNKLSRLNIVNNINLERLSCYSNQIESLDVSNNVKLTYLFCGTNELKSLNVNNNTNLTELDCDNNSISTLDVSNNKILTRLLCAVNQLTYLDVSNNSSLESFQCQMNPNLTKLYLSEGQTFKKLFSKDSHTVIYYK